MPDALTDARWAGIRALCEGALPTHERVAQAAGVYVKSISRRAGEEKWKTLDFRRKRIGAAHRAMVELAARAAAGEELDAVDPREGDAEGAVDPAWSEAVVELEPWPELDPAERTARIGAALTRHTEAMLRRVDAGQPLEGRQVAALSNLVQLSERIAALAKEGAKERQIKKDEDLADVLDRINNKIIELAEHFGTQIAHDILLKNGMSEAQIEAAFAGWAGAAGTWDRLPPSLFGPEGDEETSAGADAGRGGEEERAPAR